MHWRMLRDPYFYLDAFEALVHAVGRETGSVVLGLYVETSDFGYVSGVLERDIVARGLVKPDAARDLKNGVWAIRELERQYGAEWVSRSANAVVAWSEHAPRTLSPPEAGLCLSDEWIAPEDAVRQLKRLVGLPDPPGW